MEISGNFAIGGSTEFQISRVDVDGAVASLKTDGDFSIGEEGAGIVTVKNGASLAAGSLTLSSVQTTFDTVTPPDDGKQEPITIETQAHAELKVSEPNTKVTVEKYVHLGTQAGQKGAIQLSNRASAITGDTVIAVAPGSFGEVTIDDFGSWKINGDLTIGQGGRGDLDVFDGSSLSANNVVLGDHAGSSGVLRLRDGTQFNHSEPATIGNQGHGNLQVFGTAVMNSSGQVELRGVQSLALIRQGGTWNVAQSLLVDHGGGLQIDSGGHVSVNGAVGSVNQSHITIFDNGLLEADRLTALGGRVTIGNAGSLKTKSNITLGLGGQLVVGAGIGNIGAGQNQKAGTLRVGPGGSLVGSGSVLGNVVVDGGTIAPGESPGTLTIDGDLVLSSGKLTLEIGGDSDGEFDQLVVTGSTTLGVPKSPITMARPIKNVTVTRRVSEEGDRRNVGLPRCGGSWGHRDRGHSTCW